MTQVVNATWLWDTEVTLLHLCHRSSIAVVLLLSSLSTLDPGDWGVVGGRATVDLTKRALMFREHSRSTLDYIGLVLQSSAHSVQ